MIDPPEGSTLTSPVQHTLAQRVVAEENDAGQTHYVGDTCDPAHVIPEGWDLNVAFKDDGHKVDMSLLPYRPLSEIAEVLEFGERKYERDNWRKGFEHKRLLAALLRHIFAYNEGETFDPESGLCHLAHAGCMLFFLMETRHTHPELDYRRTTHGE